MRKYLSAVTVFLMMSSDIVAQQGTVEEESKPVYPVGDDANICYKSNLVSSEQILFEGNPIVRFSFSNNIYNRLQQRENKTGHAFYVAFEPQLRMYIDNSLPVKTPSYRVQLGYQRLWRKGDNFLTAAIESGHYSNGQQGCAFSTLYDDGSMQCDSIYATITDKTNLSDLLNRINGNFSTNYTDLLFNYRVNAAFDRNQEPITVHSFTGGLTLFHDNFWFVFPFGGYSDNDIKIYGRVRWIVGYEFIKRCKGSQNRYALSADVEIIQGAHQWVNPWRSVVSGKYYPIKKFKEFGVFASYIYGHDNYNFRFVDKGHQFAIGLTWSRFAPFSFQKQRTQNR